jgi:OmcA/MtrC family decaheme c-type cytochrome
MSFLEKEGAVAEKAQGLTPLIEAKASLARQAFALFVLATVACGPTGPPGSSGPVGPPGTGCPNLASGQTPGVKASISVSSPSNGQFFVAGEQPVLTIYFVNNFCGQLIQAAQLSSAQLMVYGPRAPLQTVTTMDLLLDSPVVTFSAYANLQGYADGGPPNLQANQDGVLSYTLNPISNLGSSTSFQSGGATYTQEVAGTYSAAVFAIGANPLDQDVKLVDFQIGTTTVEAYATGPSDGGQVSAMDDNSSCFACHQNFASGGKTYMAHIAPEPPRAPVGNYALDSLPVASCKACHNNAGYSPNTLLRKVHAVHRGEHQLAPGVAHPEYGEGMDSSLLAFLDVGFPMMPVGGTPFQALTADVAMEKNCTACHVSDVWQTKLSRAACGSCHDNIFFAGAPLADGGVDAKGQNVVPATVFGQPSTGPCEGDQDCTVFPTGGNPTYSAAKCDVSSASPTFGSCILTTHPVAASANPDVECASCHAASTATIPGLVAPVDLVHNISQWSAPITLDGYSFQNVSVTGGSGPGGSFNIGDKPMLSFQLLDSAATPVSDLQTNAAWAGTFILSGPTSNPQRVYGSASGGLSMKTATTGTLTYSASTGTYSYSLAAAWPANSLAPIFNPAAGTPPNPNGSYTVWFYWTRTTNGIRDAVDARVVVPFGANDPVQPRQVVTQAACAACHGQSADGFPRLALHGDQRKNAETCSSCHTENAFDVVVGGTGAACTASTQCGGFSAGWETCNLPADAGPGVCTVTVDPTPGITIDFQQLIHNIHFARLREGYTERHNLGNPAAGIPAGTLNYLGFQNSLSSFQQVLSPVDVRACTNCHQDTKAACSSTAPCGYGQACVSGVCQNDAWLNPTTRACITCHDSADVSAHAALNTFTPDGGPAIESCNLCHGAGGAFPVDVVHNITSLYSVHLAYPRER